MDHGMMDRSPASRIDLIVTDLGGSLVKTDGAIMAAVRRERLRRPAARQRRRERNAFAWGARRVWVHTCSNDHPNALNNYLKSAFKIFKVEEKPASRRGLAVSVHA